MKFASLVKKGLVAVTVTGTLVMVAKNVQYNGDLISGLNGKLDTLESMLGTYSSRYNKDKGTIEGLRGQLESANGKVTSLQDDLKTLAGALGVEMDDSMGFDTPEKYEKLKTAINTKITALKTSNTNNDTELKAVAGILGCADTDDISDTVQDLFNNYSEAQAEVIRLEGELKTANTKVTSLKDELDKANTEIARLEGIINDYEGDLGEATTKAQGIIDGKQTEIDEIKNDTSNPSNPGDVASDKSAKEQAWEAFANSIKSRWTDDVAQGIKNGTIPVNATNGNVGTLNVGYGTLTDEQLRLYNEWLKIPANN